MLLHQIYLCCLIFPFDYPTNSPYFSIVLYCLRWEWANDNDTHVFKLIWIPLMGDSQ